MSKQKSFKQGKQSDTKKQEGTRYDYREAPVPSTSPVEGAFGKEQETRGEDTGREQPPAVPTAPGYKERVVMLLERERATTEHRIEALKKEPLPQEARSAGDNTPLSEPQDSARYVQSKELTANELERLIERAAAIDQALKRNEEGSYGICVDCNRPISRQRLEAVPEAARCIECQDRREGTHPEARGAEPRVAGWEEAQEMLDKERYES